jgi:hypothetical protein
MQYATFSNPDTTRGTGDRCLLFGRELFLFHSIRMQKCRQQNSSIRHTLRISHYAPVSAGLLGMGQGQLVVQDDTEQGIVNVDLAVGVVDEVHLAEFVHEKIDSRPRGANHLRQRFLRHLGQ